MLGKYDKNVRMSAENALTQKPGEARPFGYTRMRLTSLPSSGLCESVETSIAGLRRMRISAYTEGEHSTLRCLSTKHIDHFI